MRIRRILPETIIICFVLNSCHSNDNIQQTNETNTTSEVYESKPSEKILQPDSIDAIRTQIESLQLPGSEILTKYLREKIKQKWSKIHFYVQEDVIVKIKTYPHATISKRTEEFYANKDGLLMVVIDDNGNEEESKDINETEKLYYFDRGKLIKEVNKEVNGEYTVRHSDAEELLSEFNEYVEIYRSPNKY
jgi:hypothetical protein